MHLTQQVALIVDLYLKPEYLHEKNEISRLSLLDTPASDALLLGYIREGMRLQGVVIGLRALNFSLYIFTG